MKLYHYMDAAAYRSLNENGYVIGSPEHSTFPDFAEAYAWLADVMADRIGPAPQHAHPRWPVFSWHLHNGLDPVAYDAVMEYEDKTGLLVGFDVPDDLCVLSDFDDWHYILNGWYLPTYGIDEPAADKECEDFDARCKTAGYDLWTPPAKGPDPDVERMRRKNWKRVVDYPTANGSVQATTWELRLDWMFFVRVRNRDGLDLHPRQMSLLAL